MGCVCGGRGICGRVCVRGVVGSDPALYRHGTPMCVCEREKCVCVGANMDNCMLYIVDV